MKRIIFLCGTNDYHPHLSVSVLQILPRFGAPTESLLAKAPEEVNSAFRYLMGQPAQQQLILASRVSVVPVHEPLNQRHYFAADDIHLNPDGGSRMPTERPKNGLANLWQRPHSMPFLSTLISSPP